MRQLLRVLIVLLTSTTRVTSVTAEEPRDPSSNHVLLIGIDGCRFDVLDASRTPALHGLLERGAHARDVLLRAPGHTDSETMSAPGWGTIFTGFWPHQHGTLTNLFPPPPRPPGCPDIFARIRAAHPTWFTLSLAAWAPINQYFASAQLAPAMAVPDPGYVVADEETSDRFLNVLTRWSPRLAFIYFGQVDEAGHRSGFKPDFPHYLDAIERVDEHVERIVEAVEKHRRIGETWTILVTTDHGGRGSNHYFVETVPDEMLSFVIIEGEGVSPGPILPPVGLVDIVPTILACLGLPVDPSLPGRPLAGTGVGLARTAAEAP